MDLFIGILKYVGIIAFAFITVKYRQKLYHATWLAIKDIKKRDPDEFRPYGVWFYCGLMGSGKTISLTEKVMQLKKQYPNVWIAGNYYSPLFDETFSTWEQFRDIKNPKGKKYGCVKVFDEIHLTFTSTSWKSAPEGLLESVSMQRKNYTLVLGSSQVFTRIDKKLREQSNYIVECKTILNRWTFQKAFITEEYMANGDLKDVGQRKRRKAWTYNFVQTDSIRNQYDTYELLSNLTSQGKRMIAVDDLLDIATNKND